MLLHRLPLLRGKMPKPINRFVMLRHVHSIGTEYCEHKQVFLRNRDRALRLSSHRVSDVFKTGSICAQSFIKCHCSYSCEITTYFRTQHRLQLIIVKPANRQSGFSDPLCFPHSSMNSSICGSHPALHTCCASSANTQRKLMTLNAEIGRLPFFNF